MEGITYQIIIFSYLNIKDCVNNKELCVAYSEIFTLSNIKLFILKKRELNMVTEMKRWKKLFIESNRA